MDTQSMDTQSMDTQSSTIRFEACSEFRTGDDHLVCACGWFEDEHAVPDLPVTTVRMLRRPVIQLPERRAS